MKNPATTQNRNKFNKFTRKLLARIIESESQKCFVKLRNGSFEFVHLENYVEYDERYTSFATDTKRWYLCGTSVTSREWDIVEFA